MSQENVDKARDFIAAYNRRDFDAAVGSFDPEIEWVLPPRQSSDSCRGPDEVKRFWEGLDETFEELRLEPQEFVDAGDRVATRLRREPDFAKLAKTPPLAGGIDRTQSESPSGRSSTKISKARSGLKTIWLW